MRRNYFAWISGVLLGLSVWGFSDNLLWDVGQPSNSDPKFIVHGGFCLAWMLVFCVQTRLVRAGRVRLHRRLGVFGAVIALGVTVSTLWVFVAVWKGWDAMAPFVKANRILLPSYALMVLMGILLRRRPEWHKRCLLVATLYMLEPVLSRAFDPIEPLLAGFTDQQIDFAWYVFFVLAWSGLFASLFVYDWLVTRGLHPATLGGSVWFAAVWSLVWFL